MPSGIKKQGFDGMRRAFEGISRRLALLDEGAANDLADAVHSVCLYHWQSTSIPRRSGRLARSLRNPSHPEHLFVIAPGFFQIGSKVPYFQWISDLVAPVPAEAIERAVFDHLFGEVGS